MPFPATLGITTSTNGQQSFAAGCDGQWHDMTNALCSTPWNDIPVKWGC